MSTERRILAWGVLAVSVLFLLLGLFSGLVGLAKLARGFAYDPVFKLDALDVFFLLTGIGFVTLGLPPFIWAFSALWRADP
ncbi:MAG: hypothetical protein HYY05_02815 [Chloroflexi bacterium]|nr:hypothetical protein [Chloroflexota bacterium]